MQLSVGVEYALHCLIYIVDLPTSKSVSVKDIAGYQGVSETYLSKIFTKLRKSGIVKSIPGIKGGYALARSPEVITFWDIIEAIEGSSSIFQCTEIRQKEILLDKNNLPEAYTKCPCLIKTFICEAEEQMRRYLRDKTLFWLCEKVNNKVPSEIRKATKEWFNIL